MARARTQLGFHNRRYPIFFVRQSTLMRLKKGAAANGDRGTNLKVESYGREQNMSGPEALATEIVGSNPDVIFVVGPGAVFFEKLTLDFAAKKALIVPGPDFRKLSSSSQGDWPIGREGSLKRGG
jgi:hypothetical protein